MKDTVEQVESPTVEYPAPRTEVIEVPIRPVSQQLVHEEIYQTTQSYPLPPSAVHIQTNQPVHVHAAGWPYPMHQPNSQQDYVRHPLANDEFSTEELVNLAERRSSNPHPQYGHHNHQYTPTPVYENSPLHTQVYQSPTRMDPYFKLVSAPCCQH